MSHWRKQQHLDRYFRMAKEEGYRARSAYKLLQIQEKYRIIRSYSLSANERRTLLGRFQCPHIA